MPSWHLNVEEKLLLNGSAKHGNCELIFVHNRANYSLLSAIWSPLYLQNVSVPLAWRKEGGMAPVKRYAAQLLALGAQVSRLLTSHMHFARFLTSQTASASPHSSRTSTAYSLSAMFDHCRLCSQLKITSDVPHLSVSHTNL